MSGKGCHCEEGLPEWIMSYADMITILMAFFVVMYSMAGNKDTAKEQAVLKSLRAQFGATIPGMGQMLPGLMQFRNASQLDMPHQTGAKTKNKQRGGIDEHRMPKGDHARVHAPWPGEQSRVGGIVYFPDDSSTLGESQEQSLKLIAAELGGKPQKIEIRGHTSRRTAGSSAKDNWDLAYARCRSTMNYLVSLGIDPQRIRLGVAGDNEPVGTGGDASAAYTQNARVEVFLLNEIVDSDGKRVRPKAADAGHKIAEPEKTT